MNSDQLSLDLRMPWGGYDPRSLTKGANLLTFRAGTGRSNPKPILQVVQLELFPEGTHYGS